MRLDKHSLNWAKNHIIRFADSDFFVKPFEFKYIWRNWDSVTSHLTSVDLDQLEINKPRFFPAPKPGSGFRIVHQLDPIDTLIYTSLAYRIADLIENKRKEEFDQSVFSYRIETDEKGNFFSTNKGYKDFSSKSQELANSFRYVLVTDITDFYNQIDHSRLQKTIASCDQELKEISINIEEFLWRIYNQKNGIPVGPYASIIMSEALCIDIDSFIQKKENSYIRYVDDIRIFSDSEDKLHAMLSRLTSYLYSNHRLSLSSAKTEIIDTHAYLLKYHQAHNTYIDKIHRDLIAVTEPLKDIRTNFLRNFSRDPYLYSENLLSTKESINIIYEKLENEYSTILNSVLDSDKIDLSIARHLLRTARKHKVRSILMPILKNFDFFTPVLRDVVLYLQAVTDEEVIYSHLDSFERVIRESKLSKLPFVRYWLCNFFANYPQFSISPVIRKYLMNNSSIRIKCLYARNIRSEDIIRKYLPMIDSLGYWDRRGLIYGLDILCPKDKRKLKKDVRLDFLDQLLFEDN